MQTHQAQYPIATMAAALGVSPSGYYAWRKRPPSRRALEDEQLLERIVYYHQRSGGTYGAPRIHQDLVQEDGRDVGLKRVARLMRLAGIQGVTRRRRTTTTRSDKTARPAPDLVNRAFTANGPDAVWVADITYVPTQVGFFYLAIVLDVWSRRVVGWAMADHLRTQLVLDALNMAIDRRCPKGVIHHSDQGCQYTSLAFGQRCEAAGIRPSMGSVGDCYDNAMAESFFATLECELIACRTFVDKSLGKRQVFSFIEGFYNNRRRHSALDYLSPADYERRCRPAA